MTITVIAALTTVIVGSLSVAIGAACGKLSCWLTKPSRRWKRGDPNEPPL